MLFRSPSWNSTACECSKVTAGLDEVHENIESDEYHVWLIWESEFGVYIIYTCRL